MPIRSTARATGGASVRPMSRSLSSARRDACRRCSRRPRADGVDLAVIDTRPSVEGDTAEIARLADAVLIPTRCGILDLRAIRATAEVIHALRRNGAAIVLNAVPASRGFGENALTGEARRALAAYGLPVAPVAIG